MNTVKSIDLCKSVIQTSYDIVKAHGGEIRVNTKENEGTVFTIILPA
jgi:signal transduction histidine kinase